MTTDIQALMRSLQEQEPDWAITWLIEHADPELWAPRQFVIVDELCKGSPSLAATWRAIYRLWLLYRPMNRRHFGLRQIASLGGVGRGHLGGKNGAIRTLHNLELITVTGLSDNPRDDDTRSDRWEYHVDAARLEAMSVRLVRSRIASGQRVASRRSANAQHHDLFVALDIAPDEALLDSSGARQTSPPIIEFPGTAPTGDSAQPYSASNGATFLAGVEPYGAERRYGDIGVGEVAPYTAHSAGPGYTPMEVVAPDGAAHRRATAPSGALVNGQMAPNEASRRASCHHTVPQGAGMALDHGNWHLRGPHDNGQLAPDGTPVALPGALGSIERSNHGLREGTAQSAVGHTHTEALIAEMINRALTTQLPALIAQVGTAVAAQLQPAKHGDTGQTHTDPLPEPPSGEPSLPMPLQAIWEMVSGHPITSDDLVHIKMLVDRYQVVTRGYSEYWLGRVMLFAHLCRTDDGEPVKLKVVNGYMKRMAGLQQFSTEALEDRKREKERGGFPKPPRTPREETEQPATATSALRRGVAVLPGELAGHWVIETWRAFAGNDAVILVERAQQLVGAVTRQDLWEAVLTNWRSRYGAKANFTHFDGLIETYQREAVAKPTGVTCDEFDPDGPPPSASVIDNHPGLGNARGDWYRRFHAAGDSKAAKQAVIRRLLAEHPIEPTE